MARPGRATALTGGSRRTIRWLTSWHLAPVLVLLLSSLLAAAPPDRPQLIVLDLAPGGGVDPTVASALSEAVASEVGRAGYYDAIASKDVQTLLGLERQKQLLGCSDADAQSCLTEIAGAIGARFVMSGSVAKLGDSYQLSLMVLDSQKAQPVGRSTRLAKDLSTLRGVLPWAVAEASGTPAPPEPSRVVPMSLLGAGAAVVIASAAVGLDGIARDRETSRELQLGEQNRSVLQPIASYREEAARASMLKTVALIGLVAGSGLVGSGIYLNTRVGQDFTASLVPSSNGFALVGSFR